MTDTTPITTTDNGAPVASDEHSQTVGADGPSVRRTRICASMARVRRQLSADSGWPERAIRSSRYGGMNWHVMPSNLPQPTDCTGGSTIQNTNT